MRRNYTSSDSPSVPDRLISGASYLTMGIVGFIWLIIISLQKSYVKPFLKYHILQSIFLSIIMYVFTLLLNVIYRVARNIPGINDIVELIVAFIMGPIVANMSVLNIILGIIVIYFAITSIMGKYSYFPWISDNIRQML